MKYIKRHIFSAALALSLLLAGAGAAFAATGDASDPLISLSYLQKVILPEIFNQFDTLRRGKTTIFVSHRLSSATVASKVVVLEYGRIIEEGNHYDLMRQQGRYYELFSTQAKRYVEGSGERPAEDHPRGPRGQRPHREHAEIGE